VYFPAGKYLSGTVFLKDNITLWVSAGAIIRGSSDVKDLEFFDFTAETSILGKALIRLNQVDGAIIHGCRPSSVIKTLIRLDGDLSDNITVMNNDFSSVEQIIEKGEDVSKKALYIKNNRFPD